MVEVRAWHLGCILEVPGVTYGLDRPTVSDKFRSEMNHLVQCR